MVKKAAFKRHTALRRLGKVDKPGGNGSKGGYRRGRAIRVVRVKGVDD
jgi:hypothetical protein